MHMDYFQRAVIFKGWWLFHLFRHCDSAHLLHLQIAILPQANIQQLVWNCREHSIWAGLDFHLKISHLLQLLSCIQAFALSCQNIPEKCNLYFQLESVAARPNLASEIFPPPILLLASPTVPAEPTSRQLSMWQVLQLLFDLCISPWPDTKPASKSTRFLLRTYSTPPYQTTTRLVDPAMYKRCQNNWL